MKCIYIAGPFRGATAWKVAENVRHAERFAYAVACAGGFPMCPHTNTAHFDGELTAQFWLDGTLEMMKRCDGAIFIPRWQVSSGARAEYAACFEQRIPTLDCASHFLDIQSDQDRLADWIARLPRRFA